MYFLFNLTDSERLLRPFRRAIGKCKLIQGRWLRQKAKSCSGNFSVSVFEKAQAHVSEGDKKEKKIRIFGIR